MAITPIPDTDVSSYIGSNGKPRETDVITAVGGTGTSSNQVQGTSAAGVAAVGNPVGVGGLVNTTTPTLLASGQRQDVWLAATGATMIGASALTGSRGTSNTLRGLSSQSVATAALLGVASFDFNGTTWDPRAKPSASTVSRIPSAAASTNTTSAKATAGELFSIVGNNASGAIRYLKFYNLAVAPTVGSSTVALTLALPTGAFAFNMNGLYFSTGIAYAMTTGAADADTGALTAADVLGLNVTFA